MSVKVRIAPSPTGNLHVGTARSALFNWLYARHHGGEFVLRIEDTDLERSEKKYEEDIITGLQWLGLDWDNTEIYRQSERMDVYKKYLQQLLDEDKAVVKTYSEEEKEAIRKEGREPRDSIIVLKAPDPEREISFEDEIRGTVSVKGEFVGSLALAKDIDTPLYNFAVVVDDLEMGITHVIRGEDHISNTPKQMLIYEALGNKAPVFGHMPLILGEDRSKLSKRHGATSINEYRKDYLPEAMTNFMGFLGYTYESEILSLKDMAKQFNIKKVHKSGAIFDTNKLDWMNAQYLKELPVAEFKELIDKPDLPDSAVPIMTERLERISGVGEFSFFWEEPDYDAGILIWKKDTKEVTQKALTMIQLLAENGALNDANLDQMAAEHFGDSKGSVYWPLRVALSGKERSPGPLEIASVIGNERVKARVDAAIKKL